MKLELQSLGLNAYESATYASLVQEGISTALEVSRKSTVPHGKIYPILDSLEKKGFVKKYSGTPQRFMAVPPQVAITNSLKKKEIELSELRSKSESVITKLNTLAGKKEQDPLDDIKIISGYKNYLNLSVELHKKNKKEWCTISELSLYQPHVEAYREAVKRGIKVRILTSKEEATEEKITLWKKVGVELRMMELLPTKFSIMDDSECTVRFTGKKEYVSLWISNQSLASSLKGYFNSLWEKATVI